MRRPRLHTLQPLVTGRRLVLEPGPSRHLLRVLRLKMGAEVVLFDGNGRDYAARLAATEGKRAVVEVGSASGLEPAPSLSIHLGIGISRGERMDFALQKAVELGVNALTPLFTERSVVRLEAKRLAKRLAHWQGVVIGACEQSGRRRLPTLHPALDFAAWIGQAHSGGLLLDPRAEQPLPQLPPPAKALTLLVGPEGGLATHERESAHRAGFKGVRLGPRILRTETAPLAALAAIQALWGDFRY